MTDVAESGRDKMAARLLCAILDEESSPSSPLSASADTQPLRTDTAAVCMCARVCQASVASVGMHTHTHTHLHEHAGWRPGILSRSSRTSSWEGAAITEVEGTGGVAVGSRSWSEAFG